MEAKQPQISVKSPPAQFYRQRLPSSCIDFASDAGKQIFTEALATGHLNAFFRLSSQFRTQDEPAYCGLTSLVMALNVLEVDPGRIWKGPWRWYHEDMLDCCTPLQVAQEKGINMDQFICLARCNNLKVNAKSGAEIATADELRDEIKAATMRDDLVFVASYSRQKLGQTGDGHFSPIAGYHEGQDLVLIMDTARFKYPPHWVPLSLLLDAMKTKDSETGRSRGYVLLSTARNQPGLLLFRPSCVFTVDTERGKLNSQLLDFAREWEQWLHSMVSGPLQHKDIIFQALSHLTKMKSQGNSQISLFCLTQLNVCQTENGTSYIIECPHTIKSLNEITCAIKCLITELEAFETFRIIKEYFVTKTIEERKKFLHLIQGMNVCQETKCMSEEKQLCSSNTTNTTRSLCSTGNGGSESVAPDSSPTCLDCEGTLEIGAEHAATLFFHTWPHRSSFSRSLQPFSIVTNVKSIQDTSSSRSLLTQQDGEASTFGALLMDFLSSDLKTTSHQYIREEIGTMKFKLREVIKYHMPDIVSYCCKNVGTTSCSSY